MFFYSFFYFFFFFQAEDGIRDIGVTGVQTCALPIFSAGLFISGLATLLQTLGVWRIGARLPIVQGTSFAAVSTMIAIGAPLGGEAGLRAIFGALIVAGAIAFLISPFFTRLLRFFPRSEERR